MSEPTLVEQLAEVAAATTWEGLPADVRHDIPTRVLDIVGLALAALRLDTSAAALDYARDQGGAPQATAIGATERLPAAQAAFVNGVLAHSLDYDDTHLPSILHPSATVIPAALAAAQSYGATGSELAAAVAVGLEICVRLGMAGYDRAARQSTFFERGQHATSICGALGGAAASARLAGLDADGIASAMGVAASMAAGIIEANRAGGTVKRLHCGWAAHSAVTAAELTRRGFTGPRTVLEGRFGFYEAFLSGHYDPEEITRDLGRTWVAPSIHIKPYPANHFTHAGIDAAIALRDEHGLRPDDIAAAHLGVATPTVRTIGEPLDRKQAPESGYEAQFSGPYTVAAAFFGGGGLGVGLDDFTDELAVDPARRALMSLITVGADTRCDSIYPDELPAVLTVTMRDGRTHTSEVLANRGGRQRPLTADEMAVKFADNAARVLGGDDVAAIAEAAHRLPDLGDLTELMEPTTRAKEQ